MTWTRPCAPTEDSAHDGSRMRLSQDLQARASAAPPVGGENRRLVARTRQLLLFVRFLAHIVVVFGDAGARQRGLRRALRLGRVRTSQDIHRRLPRASVSSRMQTRRKGVQPTFRRFGVAFGNPVFGEHEVEVRGVRSRCGRRRVADSNRRRACDRGGRQRAGVRRHRTAHAAPRPGCTPISARRFNGRRLLKRTFAGHGTASPPPRRSRRFGCAGHQPPSPPALSPAVRRNRTRRIPHSPVPVDRPRLLCCPPIQQPRSRRRVRAAGPTRGWSLPGSHPPRSLPNPPSAPVHGIAPPATEGATIAAARPILRRSMLSTRTAIIAATCQSSCGEVGSVHGNRGLPAFASIAKTPSAQADGLGHLAFGPNRIPVRRRCNLAQAPPGPPDPSPLFRMAPSGSLVASVQPRTTPSGPTRFAGAALHSNVGRPSCLGATSHKRLLVDPDRSCCLAWRLLAAQSTPCNAAHGPRRPRLPACDPARGHLATSSAPEKRDSRPLRRPGAFGPLGFRFVPAACHAPPPLRAHVPTLRGNACDRPW